MSRSWMACALAAIAIAAPAAAADSLSATEIALACAPPPALVSAAPGDLRLAGAQDTVPKTIYGVGETVVIAAGTNKSVSLGQQYFVRRVGTYAMAPPPAWFSASGAAMYGNHRSGRLPQTVGWVRVVAVNETTAIAAIEHSCAVMTAGDYLEPFAAPTVPPTLASTTPLGDLDFASPARVMFGPEERTSAAAGEFVITDRGASSGTANGARFAIFRDLRVSDVPLTRIGEAVVVSEGPDVAVLRITQARDAVYSGDYLVPEKKK